MTADSNGRVDYLHQELQELRTEIRQEFAEIKHALRGPGGYAERIRSLELSYAASKGAIAAISGLVSAVITAAGLAIAWLRSGGSQ